MHDECSVIQEIRLAKLVIYRCFYERLSPTKFAFSLDFNLLSLRRSIMLSALKSVSAIGSPLLSMKFYHQVGFEYNQRPCQLYQA